MKAQIKITITIFIALFTVSSFAQDYSSDRWYDSGNDTKIEIPSYGKVLFQKNTGSPFEDEIASYRVQYANYDFLSVRNGTTVYGKFVPWIFGNNETDTRAAMIISGVTSNSYDTGSDPVLVFDARRYEYPGNVYNGSPITTRNLFAWTSYATTYMSMSAYGYLGIGVKNPTSQLHTSGSIRFAAFSASNINAILQTDVLGNVSKKDIPSNSEIAFINSNNTNLPKLNNGVLINSQIWDNGTNIGIGGIPANNAKVTVYGVVNTISDERHKSNFEKIENPLQKVNELNGYSYNLIDENNSKQLGLKAQEVEKILPELVSNDSNGTKFLNYDGLIPVLTEAIKEQQKMIELQSKRIENLEKEIKSISKKRK